LWSSVTKENVFGKSWAYPWQYEAVERKQPDQAIMYHVHVMSDLDELIGLIEQMRNLGYTKIQIHSSSPDEEQTLKEITTKVLPSIEQMLD
jgi:hypothetical protein